MIFSTLALSLFTLALPFTSSAERHGPSSHNRHRDIAVRARGDIHHYKRVDNSKWSFYDVGLGACGQNNVENDFIVALNSAEYDVGGGYPGPQCFKMITMTYNGKTTQAQVMDRCPGCPPGGLDLSRGLFRFFADEGAGIIYGSWHFTDGAPPPPQTTSTPAPETTSSSSTPTPTSTEVSSSSSASSSSAASSSTSESSSASSASSANATPLSQSGGANDNTNYTGVQNLVHCNQAVIGLGGILTGAAAM